MRYKTKETNIQKLELFLKKLDNGKYNKLGEVSRKSDELGKSTKENRNRK